jgi:hypothetical protein
MSFKFEKLLAWQKAVDLATVVHELTKNFPEGRIVYFIVANKMGS